MIVPGQSIIPLVFAAFVALAGFAQSEETMWKDKDGNPAPNTEFRRSKNNFGGWLVVTPDPDWEQKWATSPKTIPHFNTSETVERGKAVTILIFFVNPKTDDKTNTDVTCDIESIRPDGSLSINQKDIVCLRGKLQGDPYYIRLSPAVIKFIGEPKDPAGKWLIHVTLKDNVRHVSLPLKTSFVLIASTSEI